MKMLIFDMEITGMNEGFFLHKISYQNDTSEFLYDPKNKELKYISDNNIVSLVKSNESQFLKILHSRRTDTFFIGFKLKFVITDQKEVTDFHDLNDIIILDRSGRDDTISIAENIRPDIHEIFTDGCYLKDGERSGYATIIKFPDGSYHLTTMESNASNNCTVELEAVIKGLEILKDIRAIRLITDSRYVRKGMTEWLFNWKLNNWLTANGDKAKNVGQWKKMDELTTGKYLEVAWVKGHSGHFENTMCDLYARDAAEGGVL